MKGIAKVPTGPKSELELSFPKWEWICTNRATLSGAVSLMTNMVCVAQGTQCGAPRNFKLHVSWELNSEISIFMYWVEVYKETSSSGHQACSVYRNCLVACWKYRFLGPTSRDSDLADVGKAE